MDHPLLIALFSIFIIGMLALDMGVFNKTSHEISNKEAVTWSLVWMGLAQLFSGVVYWSYLDEGHSVALEKFSQFQSAYWIEKALSVDNLFVFILVFGFFQVSKKHQHKVLLYGILGAIIMRMIFIFSGVGLIELTYLPMYDYGFLSKPVSLNVVMTAFGLFLLVAGVKTLKGALSGEEEDEDFSESKGAKIIKWMFGGRVTEDYVDDKFVVKLPTAEGFKNFCTPLLIVVGVIEITDLLFAVDSIPAIFAIAPNDPFILYSSNIFAILGLRALYFLLNNFIHMFKYLPYGLSIILSFIGVKMLVAPFYHIESFTSLMIVVGLLVVSVIASVAFPGEEEVAE